MTEKPQTRVRKPDPLPEHYPHQVDDIIRYADLDPQGHVNNAVFSTYFETGRVAMFRNRDLSIGVDNATFVLVRAEIDFKRELHWPGEVMVGTAPVRFGRTSFVLLQGLFCDGMCAGEARVTMVMADKTSRRPIPLTEPLIARLSQWMYRGPAEP